MDQSLHNLEGENELEEDRLWPHDPDWPSWAPVDQPLKQSMKRGRKKILEQWTRVISISKDSPEDLKVFEIETDVKSKDERLVYPRQVRSSQDVWKPIFYPKQFVKDHRGM